MQNPQCRIQSGKRGRRAGNRLLLLHSAFCLLPLLTGCHSAAHDPDAGLKATHVDPETAKFSYWLNQPPVASVVCVDFREGRLTTMPLVSKQAFEFWRNDLASFPDVAESTISTVRRTLIWNVQKQDDGAFRATPAVVEERYVMTERRLTSAMQYQEVFSDEHKVFGSRMQDEGLSPVDVYWYATGRDRNLEKRLAATVESLVASRGEKATATAQ
jgi:hypothetical protein